VEADFKACSSTPLREWFDLHSLKASYARAGRAKLSHMTLFEESIIKRMAPFFSPLFPGFHDLKNAVFPNQESYTNSPIDHATMINIFNTILAGLPKEHTAATAMKRGMKRV
jgi:hypothetical protein